VELVLCGKFVRRRKAQPMAVVESFDDDSGVKLGIGIDNNGV
jgi:hypothetical protein